MYKCVCIQCGSQFNIFFSYYTYIFEIIHIIQQLTLQQLKDQRSKNMGTSAHVIDWLLFTSRKRAFFWQFAFSFAHPFLSLRGEGKSKQLVADFEPSVGFADAHFNRSRLNF